MFVYVILQADSDQSFQGRGAEVEQGGEAMVGCVQGDPEIPVLMGTNNVEEEQESGDYEAGHRHEQDPALDQGDGHLCQEDENPYQPPKGKLEDEEQVGEGGEDRGTPGQPAAARSRSGGHADARVSASESEARVSGSALTEHLLGEPGEPGAPARVEAGISGPRKEEPQAAAGGALPPP